MSDTFQYGGTFSNNILVVVQTGCGNTAFVQNLGKKRIFGDGLLRIDWVSKINSTKSRENEIRQCFDNTHVEFHYPDDIADFELLIETFQKHKLDSDDDNNNNNNKEANNDKCNIFGENKKFDKLIVIEDGSSRQIK